MKGDGYRGMDGAVGTRVAYRALALRVTANAVPRGHMSNLDRRTFLRRGALAGGALAVQGFAACGARHVHDGAEASGGAGGYGPLLPAKAANTGETLLALPEGFA